MTDLHRTLRTARRWGTLVFLVHVAACGSSARGDRTPDADDDTSELDGADLDGADLDGADLDGADLDGADPDGADPDGADPDGDPSQDVRADTSRPDTVETDANLDADPVEPDAGSFGPPTNLVASTGTFDDRIEVSWTPHPHADTYNVYRNGILLTAQPIDGTEFVDLTAPAGGAPSPAEGLAYTPDTAEGLVLTWTAGDDVPGSSMEYTVRSVSTDLVESVDSAPASGFRGPLAVRWQVEVAGVWSPPFEETRYVDREAEPSRWTLDVPTASIDRSDGIFVRVDPPVAIDGASRTYRVRAVNEAGTSVATESLDARRTPGEPRISWLRSVDAVAWETAGGLEGAEGLDIPPPLSPRLYRACVSSDGAETVCNDELDAAWGLRLPGAGETCAGTCDADSTCVIHSFGAYCTPDAVDDTRPALVRIPPGDFTMGSPPTEFGRVAEDEGQVSVVITRPYFLTETPVTIGQWEAVIGRRISDIPIRVSREIPMMRVSWWSALWYANEISLIEGLPPCYVLPESGCSGEGALGTLDCGDVRAPEVAATSPLDCTGYRLPTEAEWEWAARGDTFEMTWEGNFWREECDHAGEILDAIASTACSTTITTERVGLREPNPFELYDMIGGRYEWTWDRFSSPLPGGTDPTGGTAGEARSVRSSSTTSSVREHRVAARRGEAPSRSSTAIGLRLARTAYPVYVAPCEPPSEVPHAALTVEGTTRGAIASWTCAPGFVAFGSTEQVCLGDRGRWSGAPPVCVAGVPCTADEDCDEAEWCPTDAETPVCAPVARATSTQPIYMAFVPPGRFTLGARRGELGATPDSEPLRTVTISHPFALSRTEITQFQYFSVRRANPSCWQDPNVAGCSTTVPPRAPTHPVENITYLEAVRFANTLSSQEGFTLCYENDGTPTMPPAACDGYRLPTDAEWEYAARAGSNTSVPNGSLWRVDCTDYALVPFAWFCGTSGDRTAEVAQLEPNRWGLYDMLGNVAERVHDRWLERPGGGTDPRFWVASVSDGVIRGGGATSKAEDARFSARAPLGVETRSSNVGFRIARTLLP